MIDSPHQPSRRAVLRGFGTALCLPWLESVSASPIRGWAAKPDPAPTPKRLLFVYVPNGIHMPDWTPTQAGSGYTLPGLLEPLAPFRNQFTVISGLAQDKARPGPDGPGDHARAAATFLTGVRARKTGGQIHLGPSADQLAADHIGGVTPFHSLALGCERGGNAGQCDSGYSCAYSHNISWRSATTPADKEIHPQRLFDRLFRGDRDAEAGAVARERRASQRSVLDYVREEAAALNHRASRADQVKLEEYLDGVREMERRIAFTERDFVEQVPDEARPDQLPAAYEDRVRLMMDLLVLALRTDRSRIATLMIANEGSNRNYPTIGVRQGHHELSHHQGEVSKQQKIRAINLLHVQCLAHLMGRLSQVVEGESTLLDRSLLLYGSGIGDGNRHNHDKLPILLAGGGGPWRHGQHLRLARETPLNNLLLSMLAAFGTPQDPFGDATGPLTELL